MKNMTIAKMHRWARKLVGLLAVIGVVVAYTLSFVTVVAGVNIYAYQIWDGNWVALTVSGIIGALLSVLVERLTLVQAAKVRVTNEKRALLEVAFAEIEHPTPQVRARLAYEKRRLHSRWSGALMIVGALVSTCAGTLFWHYLLGRLPGWQAWAFSTLFSALVSFTLVESELHKGMQSEVIGDAIAADHFVKQAGLRDAEDSILGKFHRQHTSALDSALNNDTMLAIADATALDTIDTLYGSSGRIPEYVGQERERKARELAAQEDRTRLQMQQLSDALESRGSRGKILPLDIPKRTRLLDENNNSDGRGGISSPFHRGAQ